MENYTVNRAWKFKVLTVLAIAVALSLGVYMYQGNNITLEIEGEIMELVSYSNTVEDLLEKEDIILKKGGYINIPLDTKLEDNMSIIIKNPKSYTISQGDTIDKVESIYDTPAEILNDLDIKLEGKDYLSLDPDSQIGPGSNIEIFRVKEVIESEEEVIPFERIVNRNNNLEKGITKTIQEGQDGLKKIDYKKEYINGELSSTTIENEETLSEPVSQIVEKGTKDKIVTSRGNTQYTKAINMTATAYDASYESTGKRPGDKYYGITASGTKVRPGVVAVDPRVIPLGTKLYIESTDGTKDYGFAIAEDKGGAIKGNKIDLFFETANEVRNFGRRQVKVYILP